MEFIDKMLAEYRKEVDKTVLKHKNKKEEVKVDSYKNSGYEFIVSGCRFIEYQPKKFK